MLKTIFLIICLGSYAPGQADNLMGKGLWSLISIGECSTKSLTKQILKYDVNKHKLNRTRDGIKAHAILTTEITKSFGMYIDLCKYVDGGCKPILVIADTVGNLADKYAKDHVQSALRMSTFETDYFPLPEGVYDLKDYMVDYCNLPPVCPFGRFEAVIYLVRNLQRVACMKVVFDCNKCEQEEDCCVNE